MREFLNLLISPLPVLYILLIITIIFRLLRRKKAAGIFLFLSCLWFVIISTRPIPGMMVKSLEKRYRQLSQSEIENIRDSVNIIVLGAGYSDDKDLSPNNQLNRSAIMRLSEGVRLQKQITGSRLITSGFGRRTSLSGAVVMYRTALIFGLDSASMDTSGLPLTTNSEAEQYFLLYGTGKRLVLVTSAIHMPRAVMLFRSKGIDVIPAPADFLIRNPSVKNPWRWVPSSDNIKFMEDAIHEYGGIIWFKLGGH